MKSLYRKICFIVVLFVSIPISANAQSVQDYDTLRPVTIQIMKQLGIPVRYFIHRDDPLRFFIYNSNSFTAKYSDSSIGLFLTNDGKKEYDKRWCYKPVIGISSALDSILNKSKNVSFEKIINAKGSIIHELTHYLQQSYIPKETYIGGAINNYQAHITQINELEAYTVESYYFLSIINLGLLNEIIKSEPLPLNRNKKIINAAHSILYPGAFQLLVL